MANMKLLEKKVAIITGAGQGIGKGLALRFAREGADIVIAEYNAETAQAAASEIEALGAARAIAAENEVVTSLIGLGYHDTITPPELASTSGITVMPRSSTIFLKRSRYCLLPIPWMACPP